MFTMIYFNEWKLRGCVCIHRQCVDMHRTAINVYLHKMHSCSHPDTRHSKTARWTKMMLLSTSRRMMNIVHAHVNIEEDAPASEQATSDYHRLLREAPDLAAIVVFHLVSQKRQLAHPPSTWSPPCQIKKAFLVGSLPDLRLQFIEIWLFYS